jgi:hypothetical protein
MSLPPSIKPVPALPASRAIAARDRAADEQADAEDGDQQALGLVAGDAPPERGHMAAGDVSRLVGDDADHLVGGLGLHQRAGIDVDVTAVDDEGVETLVPDDAHRNVLRAQPRRLEDRARVVLEEILDLGVADEGDALRRRRRDGGKRGRDGIDRSDRGSAPSRAAPRLHARPPCSESAVVAFSMPLHHAISRFE